MGYVPTGGSGGASIGGSVSGATAGSVFFAGASGVLAQDNTNLFWDDSANSLKFAKWQLSQDNMQILGNGGSLAATIDWNPQGAGNGFGIISAGAAHFQAAAGYGLYLTNASIQSTNAAVKGLEINLAASQSADAFQVKNSGGTTIASIDKDGYFCGGTSGGDTRLINTSIGTWSLILEAGNTRCSIYDGSNYLFRVDGDSTAGNTRMLVYDVDNGTLERVSVGAADSGGSGFKVLRIPN